MSKYKKNKQNSEVSVTGEEKEIEKQFPIQEYKLIPIGKSEQSDVSESQIDLIDIFSNIWEKRMLILRFALAGMIIGLFFALLTPKEYRSSATLIPEIDSNGGAGGSLLQQYGGLLGLSSGSNIQSNGTIPPQLYPQIVQSLPFQLQLLNEEVEFKSFNVTTTVYVFFDEIYPNSGINKLRKYTIGLLGTLGDMISGDENSQELPKGLESDIVFDVSKEQMAIVSELRKRVTVSLNAETGVISLSAIAPDPEASADISNISIKLLRTYVANYRTRKAEQNLEFAEQQFLVAKENFQLAQNNLAEFRDTNFNIATAKARTQEQILESEYNLAFNVYNTIAQQVEQAKLDLQEQTPVVSILQPVQVPVDDTVSGLKVLILSTFSFGAIGIFYLLVHMYMLSAKDDN